MKELKRATDCFTVIGSDYRHWFAGRNRFPEYTGTRIGLISCLFNNLSNFTVARPVPDEIGHRNKETGGDIDWKNCLPSRCLGREGRGPIDLDVSNSRIWLAPGRIYAQGSLSQYFQGYYILSASNDVNLSTNSDVDQPFSLLRSFNPECMLTSDGGSILERLLDYCSFIRIQDADLRPQDLCQHRKFLKSENITAFDMTKLLGLRGYFCYVMTRSKDIAFESLKGSRLW